MKDTGADKKFVVVAYDIIKTKQRTKLMKLLKGNGDHTQKSVFECLLDEGQIQVLLQKIDEIIDPEKDTVRLYTLTSKEAAEIIVMGTGEVYEEKQLVLL